jgi:hypothetical protein
MAQIINSFDRQQSCGARGPFVFLSNRVVHCTVLIDARLRFSIKDVTFSPFPGRLWVRV